MNKKKIVALLFVFATIVSVPLAYASTWSSGTVSKVYAGYSDGSIYVRGLSNSAGCSSSTIRFRPSNSNENAIYKLAMTAMSQEIQVGCTIDGCTGSYQKGISCVLEQ